MKILFTINNIYNATGLRALLRLASAFHRRGNEVSLLVNKKGVTASQRPFYELDEEIKIHNIRPWLPEDPAENRTDREISKSSSGGSSGDDTHKSQKRIIDFPRKALRRLSRRIRLLLHRNKHTQQWWEAKFEPRIRKLREKIHEIDPDIVVAFLPSSFTYVAQALRDSDIPFLVANRNNPFYDYTEERFLNSRHDVKMRFEAVRLSTLNLVQLETYKGAFPQEAQAKTRVIPNSVEPVPEFEIATPEADSTPNVIVNIGRLHPQKNQAFLIEAFAAIADRHPDWVLCIVGAGVQHDTLTALVEQHGLTDRVQLVGTQKDVGRYYANAKIFAFPSLFEGFSNAHLEAMSHGLPSVGLKSCIYMREIVQRSESGLLSDDTAGDFAVQLESLINDPDRRGQLGRNGRKFAAQFQPDEIVDQWIAVLEEARSIADQSHPVRSSAG